MTQRRLEQLERVLRGLDGLLQDAKFIDDAARGHSLVPLVLAYHDCFSWLLESMPGKLKCHEILTAIADRWPQIATYATPVHSPEPVNAPPPRPASEHPRAARQSTTSDQQQSLEF